MRRSAAHILDVLASELPADGVTVELTVTDPHGVPVNDLTLHLEHGRDTPAAG